MLAGRAKNVIQGQKLTKLCLRSFRYEIPETYNKRWQWEFKHAYYTHPKDPEPVRVMKPEETSEHDGYAGSYFRHWKYRLSPGIRQLMNRSYRCATPYEMYLLPAMAFIPLQFATLDLGFRILTALPLLVLYTRIRDKLIDPKPEETFLLEMIHSNEIINKHFKVETMQILDHEIDYTKGFPCEEEFPEFKNKLFSFIIRIFQC
jgi:hypothetical protein